MKKALFLSLVFAAVVGCASGPKTPLEAVNVFNGTGFHGHTYPGATTPHGLVQLSPDTRTYGWDGCSGYHYSDSTILGFSHTHLSGTGCADLGDFLFTPGVGQVVPLAFRHKDEEAWPGYYKVETPQVGVELTATPHVGVHRYTFKGAGERLVLIDATHCIGDGNVAVEAWVKTKGESEISAKRLVNGWVQGREIYLNASFSVPFAKADEVAPGKLLLTFPEDTEVLTIYAGLSYESVQGARNNRIAETDGQGFEDVLDQTTEVWEQALGAITVQGGPVELFYTCLYHTLVVPNRLDDTGSAMPFYSTLSLWDTFRSWNPLQTLTNPALVNDMINSMLQMYRSWGELPIWPLGHASTERKRWPPWWFPPIKTKGRHRPSITSTAIFRPIRWPRACPKPWKCATTTGALPAWQRAWARPILQQSITPAPFVTRMCLILPPALCAAGRKTVTG